MDFAKVHEELNDKTSDHFKDKARKECLWLANSHNLFVAHQSHIRCKGLSKFSGFKSQALGASASAASAHVISRASTDIDRMEISMQLTDTTLQPPQVTSPTGPSSVDQQVMYQFT